MTFGEYSQYDTTALYQPHPICLSCFKLFRALNDLHKKELELAWRLGVISNTDGLEAIPEGTHVPKC